MKNVSFLLIYEDVQKIKLMLYFEIIGYIVSN